ncbi:CBS domain-containing protein [Actinomadura madurae]|uniref:CBS domain-containing protein n=2 Tax=Actinomadura madurae TaxID=1993 RepID=UPI0020269C11|nr:CBS domain-containing protein [Actinomadura madurae]MCP9955455.1 CBS domain-containing protein [Actinomadura madurae]MCP9972191.1 CBS domain-containing protein [Actinomadura madurae]MCP9984693.1 CBS domain-containing protein [Actinomadura madurae]MCQ0003755.1 CBS domain-containing protein [Actinomadura madurae]URN00904.1 CBS domain-containing protein [Actinomadura madurae]
MTTNPPLEQRTVAELMTRDLLTIAADESVLMAWELMCRAEVHHLPVTDVEGGFLGVIDAHTLTAAWNATTPRDARRPVTTLLPSRSPSAVRPMATVPEAARAMLEADTDYAPVTDEHGALVGLITARDLIGALAGVHREIPERAGGMPSLYRIEPVLPRETPAHHAGGSGIDPA